MAPTTPHYVTTNTNIRPSGGLVWSVTVTGSGDATATVMLHNGPDTASATALVIRQGSGAAGTAGEKTVQTRYDGISFGTGIYVQVIGDAHVTVETS